MRIIPLVLFLVMLCTLVQNGSSSPLYQPGQLQKLAKMVVSYIQKPKVHSAVKSLSDLNRLARPNYERRDDEERVADGGSLDFEDEDERIKEEEKRPYDDYGHMRFGRSKDGAIKRYDDYGHMRYGK
uniref:Drosulfakinins n=1 Tax=Hadrurus spadix TaxID=141984 RepID=A0A1W7RAM0_9SCOR